MGFCDIKFLTISSKIFQNWQQSQ